MLPFPPPSTQQALGERHEATAGFGLRELTIVEIELDERQVSSTHVGAQESTSREVRR